MILSIWGFSEELHKKLKVAAVMRGVTMLSIVTEAIEGHLGVTTPVIVPSVASIPLGDSVTEIAPGAVRQKPLKKEAEWAQGMCAKHGRMAMNGKFTCC